MHCGNSKFIDVAKVLKGVFRNDLAVFTILNQRSKPPPLRIILLTIVRPVALHAQSLFDEKFTNRSNLKDR